MPCGSEGSAVRDSVEHASGCSGSGVQSSREAVPEVVCGFCFCHSSSGCGEKFHPETLCMGVDEKVISVLLDDMVGAVNFLLL